MTFIEFLVGILASVIANSISSTIPSSLGGKIADIKNREGLRKIIADDVNMQHILKELIVDPQLANVGGQIVEMQEFKEFLNSQELLTNLKRLYACHMDGENTENVLKIKHIVNRVYCYYMKIEQEEKDNEFENIFVSLRRAISRAHSLTGNLNSPKYYRGRNVRAENELKGIKNNYTLWTNIDFDDVQKIHNFEKLYRDQLHFNVSCITPPNSGEAVRVPIDDIYVKPLLRYFDVMSKDGAIEKLSYDEFFKNGYRDVVLGSPGNGKTTLMEKVAYDLSSEPHGEPSLAPRVSPILITIRDYAVFCKKTEGNILSYMYYDAKHITQTEAPKNTFEYMLSNGRAMVLFDGLDELIDLTERKRVCKEIEAFSNLFSNVRLIVTSRKVGYANAPLRTDIFNKVEIDVFDEFQVIEYVNKWFTVFNDKYTSLVSEKISGFLNECVHAEDLIENPLMLSLLCSIYKGENYIPENRPEIYKKCSDMLFEKWDKSRNIQVKLPFRSNLAPALMHLAYLIYSTQDLQAGVKEKRLIEETKKYLLGVKFKDEDKAENAAEIFVEFCSGRAWVFTDIGQGLFQFTHRTFLEYFAAYYLVRNHENIEGLYDSLKGHIAKREWLVISELSLQIYNEKLEGCVDRFIEKCLEEISGDISNERINLLCFLIGVLKYACPNPDVIQVLVEKTLDIILDSREYDERFLFALLDSSAENLSNVTNSITNYFEFNISDAEEDRRIILMQVMFYMVEVVKRRSENKRQSEISGIKESLIDGLRLKYAAYEDLLKKNIKLHAMAFSVGVVNFNSLIDISGHASIFFNIANVFEDSDTNVLFEALHKQSGKNGRLINIADELTYLGRYILDNYRVTQRINNPFMISTDCFLDYDNDTDGLCGDSLFGYYMVLCMKSEIDEVFNQMDKSNLCENSKKLIFARRIDIEAEEILTKIRTTDFVVTQLDYLIMWIDRKVNLLEIMNQDKIETGDVYEV